ncbi:hypothetical protein QJS66_00210 [Kocuria rhizophila]|nr:hypothetical protein QJS66_00210 [Kocuria rhizophila]
MGFIAFPFACLLMAAFRYLKRMYQESTASPVTAQNVVVSAPARWARFLIRVMQDPASGFLPVAPQRRPRQEAPADLLPCPSWARWPTPPPSSSTRARCADRGGRDVEPHTMHHVSDAVGGTGTA